MGDKRRCTPIYINSRKWLLKLHERTVSFVVLAYFGRRDWSTMAWPCGPTVLTRDEVRRLLDHLDGVYKLMAQLLKFISRFQNHSCTAPACA